MPNTRLWLLILWMGALLPAQAYTSGVSAHATLSDDKKRVLVMLYDSMEYKKEHPVKFRLPGSRSVILHEVFPKTGVYDCATLAPLWQADWYSFKQNLRWSPDLSSVVRLNMEGLHSDWALAFHRDGRLLRRYTCDDLLTRLKSKRFFEFTREDYHYRWYEDFEADASHCRFSTAQRRLQLGSYHLNLGLQESYVFDLSTGEIVSREISGRWLVWIYCLLLAGIFPVLPLVLALRARKRLQNPEST